MEHIYLTLVEIAAQLKTNKTLVQHLITNSEIPFTQYHKRLIVKQADLNTFRMRNSTTNADRNSQEEQHLSFLQLLHLQELS